jgi:hypothetical protein
MHQIFEHPFSSALAPITALAITAEAGRCVELIRAVDPNHPRLHSGRHLKRAIEILRPHRRGKTVARVVGERDRFVGRTKRARRDDRAEHLLTH